MSANNVEIQPEVAGYIDDLRAQITILSERSAARCAEFTKLRFEYDKLLREVEQLRKQLLAAADMQAPAVVKAT